MIFLKPSLYIHSAVAPSSYVQASKLERRPTSTYSHISFFRSLLLDMQLYSPSVKAAKQPRLETSQTLPVFGEQDKIEGKIMLDPSCQNGRLTISLEGTFEYSSIKENVDDEFPCNPMIRRYRHMFLSSSAAIPIASIPEPRTTIRDALSVRRRPSTSSLNTPACYSCEFHFELPRGSRPGEEMPSTFLFKTPAGDSQGQYRMEEVEFTYRIMAIWEASDRSGNKAVLEAPILLHLDTDFQSLDGLSIQPESWLEMPLMSERLIPFTCAVTLPRPQSFSRCSFIPYYVVFTTSTRSPTLVKEIASDATITVSIVRKITITPQRTPRSPTLPDTPPPSDESDGQTSPFALLKRSVKSPARPHNRDDSSCENKPPSEIAKAVFCVSRTLQTQILIGFPKRPRGTNASHSLPDGLYKGRVQLSKDMLPSVDWLGMSIKYYLDVSVLAGQDDVRARIPIMVY